MDDDGLMQRAAGGDTQAFGLIVYAYQSRLVRFAIRLSGDSDLAQDAVQEAFLRLWRVRVAYQPRGCLQAYLFRVVRSVCLDQARSRRLWEVLDENGAAEASGPETLAVGKGLAEAVQIAVQALPEAQRTVFILSQYEALTYAEIAEVLDCPLGTVASRKHQATETLRRKLQLWKDPT